MTGQLSPADHQGEVSPRVDRPDLRASHSDRDRVVELLRVAAGDGLLTPEELDERVEAALTARTLRELAALTTDLPAPGSAPASGAPPEVKDVVKINVGSGSAKRNGQWIVPKQIEVGVTSGNVKLDFTEAVIGQPTLRLDIGVRSGHLIVVTRPGIVVDADDVAVASGHVSVRPHAGPPVPTILRVEVSGKVRSGTFRARPPHRSFWQWLTRQPRY